MPRQTRISKNRSARMSEWWRCRRETTMMTIVAFQGKAPKANIAVIAGPPNPAHSSQSRASGRECAVIVPTPSKQALASPSFQLGETMLRSLDGETTSSNESFDSDSGMELDDEFEFTFSARKPLQQELRDLSNSSRSRRKPQQRTPRIKASNRMPLDQTVPSTSM